MAQNVVESWKYIGTKKRKKLRGRFVRIFSIVKLLMEAQYESDYVVPSSWERFERGLVINCAEEIPTQ